jgi:hypothetical protein
VGKGGRSLATWHADICSYRRLPFMEGLFSSRFTAVGVVDSAWQARAQGLHAHETCPRTDCHRIFGTLRPNIAFCDRHDDGVPSVVRQSCTKRPQLPAALQRTRMGT